MTEVTLVRRARDHIFLARDLLYPERDHMRQALRDPTAMSMIHKKEGLSYLESNRIVPAKTHMCQVTTGPTFPGKNRGRKNHTFQARDLTFQRGLDAMALACLAKAQEVEGQHQVAPNYDALAREVASHS